LERLYEKSILSEPDNNDGDEQAEVITLGGGGITGLTGPLGDEDPDAPKKKKSKKKSDTGSHSFGGGTYED
jgi:hypothetical protein